jgi:hypothetical protein
VTHSQRSPAQLAKARERLHAFRNKKREEGTAPTTPAPLTSHEREAWTAAYASDDGLGPLSSKWELQGGKLTMVWALETNSTRSGPLNRF